MSDDVGEMEILHPPDPEYFEKAKLWIEEWKAEREAEKQEPEK